MILFCMQGGETPRHGKKGDTQLCALQSFRLLERRDSGIIAAQRKSDHEDTEYIVLD